MDITNAFNQIFSLIFQGFTFAYNTLDSLKFRGISLLDFFIWVLVLSLILPIVVTLLNRGRSASRSYYSSEKRRNKGE